MAAPTSQLWERAAARQKDPKRADGVELRTKLARIRTEAAESERAKDDGSEMAQSFIAAAGTLATFRPSALVAANGEKMRVEGVVSTVLELSRPVEMEPGLWSLTLGARRRALARLGDRTAMRTLLLKNQPTPDSAEQAAFEALIAGPQAVEALRHKSDPELLRGLLEAIGWVV